VEAERASGQWLRGRALGRSSFENKIDRIIFQGDVEETTKIRGNSVALKVHNISSFCPSIQGKWDVDPSIALSS
jgi:hypothetical protein